MKTLDQHLEESATIRGKLCYLSKYLHDNLLVIRQHNERALKEIEIELLYNVYFLESDKQLKNSELLKPGSITRILIDRKRVMAEATRHIQIASSWAYNETVKKR